MIIIVGKITRINITPEVELYGLDKDEIGELAYGK